MSGNLWGNLSAIFYFLCFQLGGILLIHRFFHREGPLLRLLLGSSLGSLLLHWLPVLFAFFTDFDLRAQLLSLGVSVILSAYAFISIKKTLPQNDPLSHQEKNLSPKTLAERISKRCKQSIPTLFFLLRRHLLFWIPAGCLFLFWCYLLDTHTLKLAEDGSLHTGQATYGDMNMHLGFLTGIAVQKSFPPDYSIFPGTRLSYPFLSDSISSGLLQLGAGLRTAYILPMLFAFAQMLGWVYQLGLSLWHSRRRALTAWILFFFNGGLGFVCFLGNSKYHFSDIFTGFYTTPTNLTEENIRWVNVIADILLPQRASLFGYALVLPCLFLLYRGVFETESSHSVYFLFAGLFAGALPMIHTHSFLAVGLISASWLLLDLYRKTSSHIPAPKSFWFLGGFLGFLSILQYFVVRDRLSGRELMYLSYLFFGILMAYGSYLLYRHICQSKWLSFLRTWGLFLAVALLLSLPQLFYWTFSQVSAGGFVRGHFNWGNLGDFYPLFYLKNMGFPLLLILAAVCAGGKRRIRLFLPAGILWFLAELVVFTPNTYDNNKLLYLGYLLLILGASDFLWWILEQIRDISVRIFLLSVFFFFSCISGVLTLGREAVSDYILFGQEQRALAEFVLENTPADACILTELRHNNEIAALTGRNIVCGADTFLYFHGIDTSERKEELQTMFEAPADSQSLYEKYGVDYCVLSPYERDRYAVDEEWFRENLSLVFSRGDWQLYQRN